MTLLKSMIAACLFIVTGSQAFADEIEYPPYYMVTSLEATVAEATDQIKVALEEGGFEVIGEYQPAASPELYVICYTRDDLANICLNFSDRGALASVLKVGLKKQGDRVDVSMINPEYIFYAYLYEGIDPYLDDLQGVASDAKTSLSAIGTAFEPFGGYQDREELEDYHYKIMMPYFTDPVILAEYSSFEAGLRVIRKNISSGKGNTTGVYEVVFPEQKIAIFGIGLLDPEEGEAEFLPIIGDDHVAAMPYEIILQDKEVSMLHGRYRIALHWPELGMGTFMKIMSTPGNIEEFMEGISEE